ncbi:MAG: SDR family oxidoreductase [Dehalococcoidia bacterium]
MMQDLIDPGSCYLITGGAGFIGSNLVEAVLQGGARVRVLDDFSTGRRANLDGFRGDIEIIEGSLVDPAACARAVQGSHIVLHQAALPSVPRSIRDPIAAHEANATGTLNILRAARDAGVRRFVYASSSSAYGNAIDAMKRESLPATPLSPYAVAKLAGEYYARVFWQVYELETVCLRYFNVFGPRQDPNSPYSAVIPLFLRHAQNGTRPTIFGDGEQTRDFTYVSNAVQANLLAATAQAGNVAGEVFNVGCGQSISVNRLWLEVQRLVGVTLEPIYQEPRAGDVRGSMACIDKARDRLGYQPAVDVLSGLRPTWAWCTAELKRSRQDGASSLASPDAVTV